MTRQRRDALRRALRDIADGHLNVTRSPDGTDSADRHHGGAGTRWWEQLEREGLYVPPATGHGRWHLTTAGSRVQHQIELTEAQLEHDTTPGLQQLLARAAASPTVRRTRRRPK